MAEQCKYSSPLDSWRCTEEVTTRDGLCIFHDPDLSKDVSLLRARFEARLAEEKEGLLRFDGAIFRGPWWKQGLHALFYSFQAGTLGRVGFYQEKVRLAARVLHIAEAILVPVQFGFFLFALRNRFRR